ncbi:Kinase family protein [Quillaja saponaria]|uniref:Kinase family protein n=1 Tax=Quillaja saponaria TaxID=32244 RepID=A0AAD7PVW9_QUISA|nr:Kinase family protein [Quillaja saponaria]
MEDTSSVNVILEFLRRNKFTRAEAALRSELSNHPDENGFHQKLTLEEKAVQHMSETDGCKPVVENPGIGSRNSSEVSKELIVKEIKCGTVTNAAASKWKNALPTGEHNKIYEVSGTSNKSFTFSKGSDDTVLDLYSSKYNPSNGPFELYKNNGSSSANIILESEVSERSKNNVSEVLDASKPSVKSEEDFMPDGKRTSWIGGSSKASIESNCDRIQINEPKELDRQRKFNSSYFKESSGDNSWSRSEENVNSSAGLWKDCSVKTVFPFSKGDMSTSYENVTDFDKKEGKRKEEMSDVRAAGKEQVDEVGRALYFGKSQFSSDLMMGSLGFPLALENQKEEFPRLPPVKLKSEDKSSTVNWEEKFRRDGPPLKLIDPDNNHVIGTLLDVPVGQEINSAGIKRVTGGSWLSVSQGIAEDTSDLVSGFATVGDGLSESVDYPNEYWDSDEYDDDDDIGYMKQPIEDEAWFLAHEIDYPSDNDKGTGHGSVPDPQERGTSKDEDEDQSFAEEDVEPVTASDDHLGLSVTEVYGSPDENEFSHYGQLMNEKDLNRMHAEPVWQGFVTQADELFILGDGKILNDSGRSLLDDICIDDNQHGAVRSIGVGINSDAADIDTEMRESLIGGSSEGNLEYFCGHDVGLNSRYPHHNSDKKYIDRPTSDKKKVSKHESNKYVVSDAKGECLQLKTHSEGGFSFPPSLKDGELVQAGSTKSQWSNNCNAVIIDETDDRLDALTGSDNMLATWRQKSTDSSPVRSSRDENNANALRSRDSTASTVSNSGYPEREPAKLEEDEKSGTAREDPGASLDDEEAAAVQEQVRQIKAQEEEFEMFNLKIVHRKNRTGFEEDKNFHVVLNSVIAGRYHVTEYLGSAAFSKAIQAHDLHTGMDVCIKIIKNNKDFFDQSLDEIKLLKYVNKHDPADKCHILRLYDYFYYLEHLLIVCELLKANLYEFHKFNRESGGEVYFTMPRLQSITIQCLEALQFLHSLGLIHCDLKPENILVKSYSRCEVKVIDLGSSCFETDHLCSYVQSRSYRAPEVILGLPYGKKIDIWSLGCILAELCTGNVLFQNNSPATLLARVIGIISPIDQSMLAKGRDTYKYFTKNHMLYERNQESNRLEYLIPKKTSLRHRLPMGDQGFIDFVGHLLEINPKKRPSASEALKHPWLSYPYEPISS